MRNDGLLAWLRRLQKHLPRDVRELRVIQRLNIKRRNARHRRQFRGERRVIPTPVVQLLATEPRPPRPQSKTPPAAPTPPPLNPPLPPRRNRVPPPSAHPL